MQQILIMKKIVLLFFNLNILIVCTGQEIVLNGKIEDSKTGQPLSYATIEILSLQTGTITDREGNFSLRIIPQEFIRDTIIFSHVGYKKKNMPVQDFMNSGKVIALDEMPVLLGEIKVAPKKYITTILGVGDKKPSQMQYANVFGANKGNFLKNEKKKTGWIKSVSYYIHPDGNPRTPFRVRIYGVNDNNQPVQDILNKSVIVSANGPGWVKADLIDYHVPFPEKGVFITMEWINSGADFYFEKEVAVKGKDGKPETVKRKYYGQSLGTVWKKGEAVMWGGTLGNEWIPYDFSNKGKFIHAMIQAEVIFEEN
jgi:hypothetical protein